MIRVPIERTSNLLPAEFSRDYVKGDGVPVIVTDAINRWPACSKWTFDFFKAEYGSDFVVASPGLRYGFSKLTKLAAYLDHMDTPTRDVPGFWIAKCDGKPAKVVPEFGTPLNLLGWRAFELHPELYRDILPMLYFIDDWVGLLAPAVRRALEQASRRESWSLYVGVKDSVSELHQDFWGTHGTLAQIRGRKRAVLFSPRDSDYLYGGRVNPDNADLESFELFDRATAYECVIEPGEVLFIPPNWWHYVRALDNSITVSHNFFNAANFNEYLGHLMRRLPKLMSGGQAPQTVEGAGG